VGWFRLDKEAEGLWLGMLQIRPDCQRRGVGRAVLAQAERLAAQWNYRSLGIHTTRDNEPAQGLYTACGYALTEIGPCTTADGVERIGYTFCKNL
jgi:ribosomal protein S18 acetylase RimI-like enzyme